MKAHYRLKNLGDSAIFSLRLSHMVLGRNTYCDIHIDSGLLSRQHAEVRLEGDQVVIEDLNSTNGTFVNNMRIEQPTVLMHGDVVTVGHDRFMLIAPDKNDGSTVFTYNMSQELDEPADEDVAVAQTRLQKAFPSPLAWSSLQGSKDLDPQELNQLIQNPEYGVQYDAHQTPALLIVRSGGNQGKVYEVSFAQQSDSHQWQVGRNAYMDVVIDHPTISNHHIDLSVSDGRWRVVDRQSTNGVKVNGKRVVEADCVNGDLVTLGDLELIFKVL